MDAGSFKELNQNKSLTLMSYQTLYHTLIELGSLKSTAFQKNVFLDPIISVSWSTAIFSRIIAEMFTFWGWGNHNHAMLSWRLNILELP